MRVEPYWHEAQPPPSEDWESIREAAAHCEACWLWALGTQTVFGEGPRHARVMLVGEQPGDKEDEQGHPFVGPAGKLLDACLAEAGVDRAVTYTTNAVKHFKWEPKGARRIHKKPSYREVSACYPWLQREIEIVDPEVIVCLGATAAQALLGKDFKVTQHRGEFLPGPNGRICHVTVHPSSVLRAIGEEGRREQRAALVEDLRRVTVYLAQRAPGRASMR